MNFLIEKYLSNFVEIDTSQTKASIFSGTINLKNLKIKREIFKSLNLPYFEVVNGYIGNLLIKLKMPRFYKYPINLEIDKVFIHIKQINIDKKLKEEEIKSLEEYKARALKDEEELRQNWENVDKEESNIFQQIMNDLQIEIKEVILHLEDTISYKAVPCIVGIILNKLVIKTAKKDFGVEENITENILNQNIKYKVININNFSIYCDCFDNLNDFNENQLIKLIKENADNNNKQLSKYYEYCMNEFNYFMKNKNYHQFILYKMDLNIYIKTNDNYLKTNESHRVITINLPRLYLRFSLKQIKTLFKAKAYNNLYSLYQAGIAKEYYKKELSDEEKDNYIKKYQIYYEEKYFKKRNENIVFPQELIEIENGLSLEAIREMRNIAYNSLANSKEYYKIKKEIEEEENKWLGKNVERINELKEELKKLDKKELEISQKKNRSNKRKSTIKLNNEEGINETLSELNLNLNIKFELNDTRFIVYELVKRSNKGNLWTYSDVLIKFIFTNFSIIGDFATNIIKLQMYLEDTTISHGKTKNPNYEKLLFGETSIQSGKVLNIEFEKNPTFKYSDYRLNINFEKRMHILYDNHIFSNIMNKLMSILNTTINFKEIDTYAKEGSVNEYIQQGYVDSFLENFQHFNIELNINLLSPIILLPLDPFDIHNNKCILLSLGKLEIISELPPRQEKNVNYKDLRDESKLYDIYKVKLIGTKMSTITDCTSVNKCIDYKSFETNIIRDFDLYVECKKLIEIKNPYYDDLVCELSVSDVEMKMDEFQILFMIDYLGHFMKDNKIIFKETEIDKLLNDEIIDEENIIEEFRQNIGRNSKTKDGDEEDEDVEVNEFKECSNEDEASSELKSEVKKSNKKENEINTSIKEDNSSNKEEEVVAEEGKKLNILDLKTVESNDEEEKKVEASQRIREIKNSKKQMRIKLAITEMTLSIKKIHPDLQCENFLILVQKAFEIDCFMMKNGDMLTLLRMNNISLYDNDIDENKYSFVEQPFQCLINSDQKSQKNKVGFIDMTNLYRTFGESKEIDTIFDMNNLNIIISFDSLLRIYQFMMYYYDKYNEKMYEISHQVEKKSNLKYSEKDVLSNKSLVNNFNKVTTLLKRNSDKKLPLSSFKRRSTMKKTVLIKSKQLNIKKELYDSKITIVYNMKNTIFRIPLNPKNFGTPIIFFSFNLIYNQYMRTVYTNILKMPKNLLVERIYKIQDSKMNLLLSKVDLDIIFNIPEQSNFIYENEKLISNFRMSYLSSSFLSLKSEQTITLSDINIEPLFCKFGVRQIGKLIEFYNKVMSFWYDFCNIKYIPYMKPEYLINGKQIVKLRKRKNFRDCVLSIMIAMNLRKGIKNRLDLIRKQYKNNQKVSKIENISDFNSHAEMVINFKKLIITFYDNMTAERSLLLNLNVFHFFMKMIWNNKIRDKENVSNMIYEMVTGDELPLEKYNISNLAQYMESNFGIEINYFNMSLNEFEPLMERIQINNTMMQICSFSRRKNNVEINDMINFNISSNAIKVVNLFLLRYYKKESEKSEKNRLIRISDIKKTRLKYSTIRLNSAELDKNKEVYLVIVNFTELNISIRFENDFTRKYSLNPKGTLNFYKPDIFSDKNKTASTLLDATIEDQSKIKGIDFGKNNTRQYKLKINQKNKEYDIYISVKVNTSGLLRQVHICPSVTIFNDTNLKEIELFIKNPRAKNNSIIIKQNNKNFIPLTWFLCEEPMSNIYMKIKNNIEPIKLYDHINQIIVQPLSEDDQEERKSKRRKIEKSTKKNRNKFWNQNEINEAINECDNRKDNLIVNFTEDNKKLFFSIDYYFIQSKEIKDILDRREQKLKLANINDTMTTMEEFSNDYWYDYLVYIRPFATFYNQLPIDITFTHGNSNEKLLKNFNNTFIYNDLREEKEQIRITFNYNGDKYRSNYFDITNKTSVELINYDNQSKENLFCCILKSKKKIDFNKNFNYDVKLIEFSTSSYNYTFYFKYLIMNKLSNTLWAKPFNKKKSKKEKVTECELKSGTLTIMTLDHNSNNKFMIREEKSKWSEPFDLRTINKKGTIEIDTEIEKEEKNIINTKDISCILSWGKNYENSRILIFQEQYLIHNKLDFDIYYRQEKDKEKTNHFLKKGNLESINRVKEKKIFRLGLFDSTCGEFNYSSPFDIGILKTVDLLIKINEQEKDNYDSHFVYTNNNKNYYILIRIESYVFDDGLIYLTITNPYLPSLKIENETDFPIKIYEEKNDERPLVINGKLPKGFPFVWKNNSEEKNELFLEIFGNKRSFSFSKYEKEVFEIEIEEDSFDSKSKSSSNLTGVVVTESSSFRKAKKILFFSVGPKNKSMTRCLNIAEKEGSKGLKQRKVDLFNLFVRNKTKLISTLFTFRIKGIGFSIINEGLVELFFISMYILEIKYLSNQLINSSKEATNDTTENFELNLNNFQIDYCLNDSAKYIIAPKKQLIPSYSENIADIINLTSENFHQEKKETPFIKFLVTREFIQHLKTMEESTIYRQIDFIIQEFYCKIDQYTLTNLLNIINEFMELLDYSKKLEKEINNQDTTLLNEKILDRIEKLKKRQRSAKVLINYLFLSSIKLYLTIRLNLNEIASGSLSNIFAHIFGAIGNTLARFTDVPIYFTEKGFENIYISLKEIFSIIYKEYKGRGTAQILKLIGSSDIIGNPVKLLEGIGTGFYELVNEPRKEFVHGPLQFGKGIAKGIGKLLSGIIGGAFGVVESISGTLYSTLQSLTWRNHENVVDEDEGPSNIATGALDGLIGGFKELKNGVIGVVLHPINETKKGGVKGFFKGLGKGLIGLAISPFSAGLKFLHSLAIGTKNTVNFIFGNSKVKIKRFRYPRVIPSGGEPMKSYDYVKAFAKSEILKIMKIEKNNIKYAEIFKCENRGFNKGLCLFVELNRILLIIYRGKIVFEEFLKNIKNCEIHFNYRYFTIKLNLKKGHSKGFKVNIRNYDFVCKFYDVLNSFQKKEEEKSNEIMNKNSSNINVLDNIEEIDSIITVEENKINEDKKEEIKEDQKLESINVNDISEIKSEKEKNKNSKKRDIIINNIIINYNKIEHKSNLKSHKTIHNQNSNLNNDTIINNESVYSSIKEDSEYNRDKILSNKKRVHFNDSINDNSIRYNSNENFIHHLIFSDSSSSISEK